MIETIELLPGVTLRCFRDSRFKQNCLSIQFLRPMNKSEAAMNALIPDVLLRGTVTAPDLRQISMRLDDLYGASVSTLVRRAGDYQATGLYCSFIADRYTLEGEALLEPMADFVRQLLLEPVPEKGCFCADFVDSEKKNLISAMESRLNNKRIYASDRLMTLMCGDDPYGLPRLGQPADAAAITPEALYSHYKRILRESPVHLFYVGQRPAQEVADALAPLFRDMDRAYAPLPPHTPLTGGRPGSHQEVMEVAQGRLAMGFTTPIVLHSPDFAPMHVCNLLFGGGMTSKLFTVVREQMSLCYDIHSSFAGSKGLLTVSAGIDWDKAPLVREQILEQLEACRRGDITARELTAAKQALLSALQAAHDSPGAIEGYYASDALCGRDLPVADYMDLVQQVTAEDVARAAGSLTLHTAYLLKGVQ